VNRKFILFIAAYVMWCLFNWVPDGAHLLVGIPVEQAPHHEGGDKQDDFLRHR